MPILVTELGIVMEVRFIQEWNVCWPILVNKGFVGNVTEDRIEQPWNALLPILVTELGIVMEVRLVQFRNAPRLIFVSPIGNVTEVRPEQSWNTLSPIDVTDKGIVTEVRPEQLWNALVSILVTLYIILVDGSVIVLGIVIAPVALIAKASVLVCFVTVATIPATVYLIPDTVNTKQFSLLIAPPLTSSLFTALNLIFKLSVADTVTVIGLVIPAGAAIKVVPPSTEYL